MNAYAPHETEIARLRARLERERREHRETLLLLDAVTTARDRAEATLENYRKRSRLTPGETWLVPEVCDSLRN